METTIPAIYEILDGRYFNHNGKQYLIKKHIPKKENDCVYNVIIPNEGKVSGLFKIKGETSFIFTLIEGDGRRNHFILDYEGKFGKLTTRPKGSGFYQTENYYSDDKAAV